MSAEEFPKILEFEVLKGSGPFELKLEDGVVLRLHVEPNAVMRMGNDPNTGAPVYGVSLGTIITLVKVPRELVKKPAQAPAGGTVYH